MPSDTCTNTRKQTNLKESKESNFLELDVWLPNINLGFEFQDQYHYTSTWYAQISRTQIRLLTKANIKKNLAQKNGTTLIVVPCWWDGELESITATISLYRPDLISKSNNAVPISLNPPDDFFYLPEIPFTGELMLASFPLDPNFNHRIEQDQWWAGEKYDGVRCCWNPINQKIHSRSGKVLPVAINKIPIFLDGELWFGRGKFSLTYNLLQESESSPLQWLRLVCFDDPSIEFENSPFEERYENLLDNVNSANPMTIVAPRILCKGSVHLKYLSQKIISDGGEGVILRKTHSYYERGRSSALLKLKASFGDQEGIVTEVRDSINLKLVTGQTISVDLEDINIPIPNVGDIVTFSFEAHSRREIPVNPKLQRIRTDITWEELVEIYENDTMHNNKDNDFTSKPLRHWNDKTMREFMENIARERNLDPLLPQTWYSISYNDIRQIKGGRTLLQKFKGYYNLLKHLFPDVELDHTAFPLSWNEIENRRQFFEKYAAENGFHHENPEFWYLQPISKIMNEKGANSIIFYHKSIPQALCDLFPNIGLVQSKFPIQVSWNAPENRRQFFENYALSNGFDAYNPENWYMQPLGRIRMQQGAQGVVYYHNDSITKALLDLFPDIGFDETKFQFDPTWRSKTNRRKLFEDYAEANNFDPLLSDNWYSQSRNKLLAINGISRVTSYHKGNITRTLMDLFPEIGLEKSKLWK